MIAGKNQTRAAIKSSLIEEASPVKTRQRDLLHYFIDSIAMVVIADYP